MMDEEGFDQRKSRRMAAIKAAKKIKKNAEDNAQKYPVYRDELVTPSHGMTKDQVIESTEAMQDLLKNISKSSDSPKSDDMPKKRRGRPPKLESAKRSSTRSRKVKYINSSCEEADYDVNSRRNSYTNFLLNDEPIVPTIFSGPKQLHVGNGGISYRESLMKFTKGLGPTAQKVASRMLQRQGRTTHAQPQMEPSIFQSPDPLHRTHFTDVNSINSLVKSTTTNQVNQPLINFGLNSNTETIANDKGKRIMVDDGKSNRKNMEVAANLDFIFAKQKGGIKIGNDLMENKDIGYKNLDYSQVGNQRTINPSTFWSNYNGSFNQSMNKNSVIQDTMGQKEGTPSNARQFSSVYPSTYLARSRNVSNSSLGFEGEVSPFSWIAQPPMQSPRPMQPPRNTINFGLNENFLREQEFQHALARTMQMRNQESNVRSGNLRAPIQEIQFLQPSPHGLVRQQPVDRLMMPMRQPIWSQTNVEQETSPFGQQQDAWFQKPPGI